MSKFVRIAVLENSFQAQLLADVLKERNIPHVIRSYHDTAYDGLFQMGQGYGCVEADASFGEQIRTILQELEQARAPGER